MLKNIKYLYLSGGGDPLLQPNNDLEDFLIQYLKISKKPFLEIMTSGITPKASQELKTRYYSNLEKVFLLSDKFKTVLICFSYSEGDNPDKRLILIIITNI